MASTRETACATENAMSLNRAAIPGVSSVPTTADLIEIPINVNRAGALNFSRPMACTTDK